MVTLLIFLVVLFILVLAHECGHFFAAKRAGVAVEEFGFSFPPRLFGVWRDPHSKKFHVVWGSRGVGRATSTLYSFNLIPLGGFVKIKGEDGEGAQDPDSFAHKSARTRAWILCAGVLMNLIVAAVLLSVGFGIGMPTVMEEQEPGRFARVEDRKLEIIHVFEKSAAATAGLKPGDRIVALDHLTDVHFNTARDYFGTHENESIQVVVMRNGQRIEIAVTPTYFEEAQRSAIGVALAETALLKYPWYVAPLKGMQATALFTIEIFRAFGALIGNLIRGAGVEGNVAGPIGIAVITGEAARLGASYLLQFMAVLSLNLAVLNILPIPALDGGRLLFVIIEKLRRGKKTRREIERMAHTVGFFALIALVVVVTVNDLGNYSEFFKHVVEKLKSVI